MNNSILPNRIFQVFMKIRRDTAVRGSFMLTIGQFIFVFSGYVINVGLARILGPVGYGQYGVVISILVWLEIILSVGFLTAATKMAAEAPEAARYLIKMIAKMVSGMGIILLLITFFLTPHISRWFLDKQIIVLLPIAAIDLLFFGSYRILVGVQNGIRNFKEATVIMVAYALSKIAFIFGFVVVGFGIIGALVGNTIASVVGIIVGMLYMSNLRESPIEKSKFYNNLRVALPSTIWAISIMLLMSTDLWVAKAVLGGKQIGYYVAALAIAKLIWFLSRGIRMLVIPEISRNVAYSSIKKARRALIKLLLLFLPIFTPLVIILQITAEQVIQLVFSEIYILAVPLLKVLLISYFLISLCEFFSSALIALGKAWIAAVIFLILSIISIPANYYFVSKFGLIGAAYGFGILSCSGVLITGIFLFQFFKKRIKSKRLAS